MDDVSVAHGRLTVSYLVRRPSEPFAATPTVPVRRSFVLENDSLIEVGSGACEAGDLDQIGSFVFVTAPHGGARVRSGFAVTGCSRTFESNVNWRLLDRVGAEIASGFAIGVPLMRLSSPQRQRSAAQRLQRKRSDSTSSASSGCVRLRRRRAGPRS